MKVHFIAIGGSIMHQLALALKERGYIVTGSDDEIYDPALTNLRNAGLAPAESGWFPEKITGDLNAVILGMHARSDNPELKKAISLQLPIYSFPEFIYKDSENKKRVAIGGSHGKTTITSMVMHVLRSAQVDFDFLVGAHLDGFQRSVKITDAPVIVCEADEYPASTVIKEPKFHFLLPHIAVISGIAWDHINVFPTFDNYCLQFEIFIQKIEHGGVLIYNEEDESLSKIVENSIRTDIRYIPYSLPPHEIIDGKTHVRIGDYPVELEVFGNHNLMNMTAAWHVCRELGISDKQFAEGISTFHGAAKRLEQIFDNSQTRVFRDFAHAPSKVAASTKALKQQFPDDKLVAVLELHTYSSLNATFMSHYKGALDEADTAIVFYSRHALEIKRMPFLQPETVREGFVNKNLIIFTDRDSLEEKLKGISTSGTNFLFMSSGNYGGLNILKSLHLK